MTEKQTPAQVIGHNIARIRKERGFSQLSFGRRIGSYVSEEKVWSTATVSAMELGHRAMSADDVVTIASFLKVSVLDLFATPDDVSVSPEGARFATQIHSDPVNDRTWTGQITLSDETVIAAARDTRAMNELLLRIEDARHRGAEAVLVDLHGPWASDA